MIYHCQVDFDFNSKVSLGKTSNPFYNDDFRGHKPKAKLYQMKNLEISSMCDEYYRIKADTNYKNNIE